MDDHQISRTSGKTFNNNTYNAEVRKLKIEIKKLEKKHKEHERHMLDTQQQLEYLIISQSHESAFFGGSSGGTAPYYSYNGNELWKPPLPSKNDIHHYHSQSLNELQQQRANYWYTPYDMDYYYINHTPNNSYSNTSPSYHHPSSSSSKSKETYDYFTLPKKSNGLIKNESINSATNTPNSNRRYDKNGNSSFYPYEYQPPSYISSSSVIDGEKHYYQLQQRQHQLLYQSQYFEHPGTNLSKKKENKKRWTQ